MPGQTAADYNASLGKNLIVKGDYHGALEHYQGVLARFPDRPPGDEALYWMGVASAHSANPDRDYRKSLEFFRRLAEDFPESPLITESDIWLELLENAEEERTAREKLLQERGRERAAHEQLLEEREREVTARNKLIPGKEIFMRNDHRGALEHYRKVLARSPDHPPGDEALYRMGLISAHYANPERDYRRSLQFFKKLVKDFPRSPVAEHARIWIGLLEVIEKTKQADIEIEEKKKELAR